MRRPLLVLLPFTVIIAACQSGAVMWGPCDPSGDPTGTDGRYSMVCTDGEWVPVMTVNEWARGRQGERVTVAPVPDRPAPATTAPPTTDPATTSTTTSTTTTVPPTPAPTISTVSPDTGDLDGGVFVTITGTGFTDAISVGLGGATYNSFTVVNDTTITLSTLPHGSGFGDVTVTTPHGTVTLVNGYLFA